MMNSVLENFTILQVSCVLSCGHLHTCVVAVKICFRLTHTDVAVCFAHLCGGVFYIQHVDIYIYNNSHDKVMSF